MDTFSYCLACSTMFSSSIDVCEKCGSNMIMRFSDVKAKYSVSDEYIIRKRPTTGCLV